MLKSEPDVNPCPIESTATSPMRNLDIDAFDDVMFVMSAFPDVVKVTLKRSTRALPDVETSVLERLEVIAPERIFIKFALAPVIFVITVSPVTSNNELVMRVPDMFVKRTLPVVCKVDIMDETVLETDLRVPVDTAPHTLLEMVALVMSAFASVALVTSALV
jgi:hypothetical protein